MFLLMNFISSRDCTVEKHINICKLPQSLEQIKVRIMLNIFTLMFYSQWPLILF